MAIGGTNTRFNNGQKFNDAYKIDLSGRTPYIVEPDIVRFNNGSGGIAVFDQTVSRIDNVIYILFGHESNTLNKISSTITTYDIQNDVWNVISTNGAISYMENTCVLGLKNYKGIDQVLMTIGGNPDGGGLVPNMYYLDVIVGTWMLDTGILPSVPFVKNDHSCLMINDTIYAIAGSRNNIAYGKPGTNFQIMLDSNNQELRTHEYGGQRSIYVRDDINQTDLIYIIGGTDSSSNSVEIIDVIARERIALYWTSSPNALSKAKRGHCLVSDGLRLFVIGGFFGIEVYNEIEYTNTFTMAPTSNPTQKTSTPTEQTLTPTQQTLIPTQETETPTQRTLIPTQSTSNPTQESSSPTLQTYLPSQSPTVITDMPTLTPSESPSLSCNIIKITTLSKTQYDLATKPICSTTIPCEWELSYKLQHALINDRPQFISVTNDAVISYTANSWIINFGQSQQLSIQSSKSFPPMNEYWQLSTNNNIRFQLKIECSIDSGMIY